MNVNTGNLNNATGIVGLSPDSSIEGGSFINQLKDQGMIPKKEIGFFIGKDNHTSSV